MLMKLAVLLLTAFVSVNCYRRYLCCSPDKWEGLVYAIGGGRVHSHDFGFQDMATLSYDSIGKQVAMHMHQYVWSDGAHKYDFKSILRYNEEKLYLIFGEKCTVIDFKYSFHPICIPASAKKVGLMYLGAGADRLNLTTYSMTQSSLGKVYRCYTSVTKGCIPVGALVTGPVGKVSVVENLSYMNIVEGIKDPKVFVPPPSCKHPVEDLKMPHGISKLMDSVHRQVSGHIH